MDTADFAKAIGRGFAIGIGTMLVATLFFLPASIVMNRFIYHHGAMRFILGLLGGVGSVITLGIAAFQRVRGAWPKLHYFGLVPVVDAAAFTGEAPGDEGSWWGWLLYFVRAVIHPVLMYPSEEGYTAAVQGMLVPESDANDYTKVVNEPLHAAAVAAAATSNHTEWSMKMSAIRSAFPLPTGR